MSQKAFYSKFSKIATRVRLALKILTQFESDPHRTKFNVSFSQFGEDTMVHWLLGTCGVRSPQYLDIGAHHPEHLSNTALFYLGGGRGINIEPDPVLFAAFPKARPGDINLNIGITDRVGVMDFYRMKDPSLNTFSALEARQTEAEGIPIVAKTAVPVDTIRNVLNTRNFKPDFLSIDVEGLDLTILRGYDFETHRPKVICAETGCRRDGVFSRNLSFSKNRELMTFIESKGYAAFADTLANTLYVDTRLPQFSGFLEAESATALAGGG